MSKIFEPLTKLLPQANVHPAVEALLAQGDNHQIIFMDFVSEAKVPAHSHAPQWEIVVDGELDLTRPAGTKTYRKGEWFLIEDGEQHSAHVKKGYKAIVVFFQPDRYAKK
jgi:quercetin dioxygenase-like cupin family protein